MTILFLTLSLNTILTYFLSKKTGMGFSLIFSIAFLTTLIFMFVVSIWFGDY